MEILIAIQTTRVELRDILWLANHLLEDTCIIDMAPAIWEDIRESLETPLTYTSEQISSVKRWEHIRWDRGGRTVSYKICMEHLPSVFLLSCGHVLCHYCSKRVYKCLFCRKIKLGRKDLFL